jgi:hypothetical protein
VLNWPEPWCHPPKPHLKNYADPAFQDDATVFASRITSVYASMIISASFWDDQTIARKSDNYFHFHNLFASQTRYGEANREGTPTKNNPTRLVSAPPARLHPGEQETITEWREKQDLWRKQRAGWYRGDRRRWRDSPVRFHNIKSLILFPLKY